MKKINKVRIITKRWHVTILSIPVISTVVKG